MVTQCTKPHQATTYQKIALSDGNVLRWQEFWDQFEATIHNAKFFSIDKMNYLRSQLTGKALNAITDI